MLALRPPCYSGISLPLMKQVHAWTDSMWRRFSQSGRCGGLQAVPVGLPAAWGSPEN